MALWAAMAMSSSAAKKLLDGGDQLFGGLQVFVVVKVLHALCLDLSGSHDAVLEHAVHDAHDDRVHHAAGVAAILALFFFVLLTYPYYKRKRVR